MPIFRALRRILARRGAARFSGHRHLVLVLFSPLIFAAVRLWHYDRPYAKIIAMLIPRFTIRWLLLLTTICAVIFLIVGFAVRGEYWAIAISTSVVSLAFAFFLFGLFFVVAFVLASLFGIVKRAQPAGGTPFATSEPPPQVIPPIEDAE